MHFYDRWELSLSGKWEQLGYIGTSSSSPSFSTLNIIISGIIIVVVVVVVVVVLIALTFITINIAISSLHHRPHRHHPLLMITVKRRWVRIDDLHSVVNTFFSMPPPLRESSVLSDEYGSVDGPNIYSDFLHSLALILGSK